MTNKRQRRRRAQRRNDMKRNPDVSLDDPTRMIGVTASRRVLGGGICSECGKPASTLMPGDKCPNCYRGEVSGVINPFKPRDAED
jgi:hypothetical protein